jgi:hypothetical protein
MREIVDAVKTAVPDAANRPAGQVLEYVRAKLTVWLLRPNSRMIWRTDLATLAIRFCTRNMNCFAPKASAQDHHQSCHERSAGDPNGGRCHEIAYLSLA